ncbi:pentapeptide repeat-containing protein [Salipiger mangrovisoli]|uniref:Pentapeptide repeat-containing protein n=1 Tax=Salipiger mangrovisoli TaxID=2865933 RepID=A0ABR9XAJ4_9RHOB|nr:pentapeptide repeat-containing protein [Salipiger mangrovisoli]MBE9640630.1 pentapeptide repeat-containing protein [Salipiger mangrovisoli]
MGDRKPTPDLFDWLGIRSAPDWQVARSLGPAFAVFVALLIAGAYVTAFAIVYRILFGESVANLGAGALVAALLGAPFVIWGTVLKHQTLRYQKEGHITDRVTSAVQQLGSEKAVNRIGRPVLIWTGTPKTTLCAKELKDKYLAEPRSRMTGSEWGQHYNSETDEVWEGTLYKISIWPTEKTVIQWQGDEVPLKGSDEIGHFGEWQVFTESKPNIEVRIGGIISLERIAQDSTLHDKGRDHVRVMEILCAYVRENSPAAEAPGFDFPQGCNQNDIEKKVDIGWGWISNETTLRADVQLALSVIGRRTPQQVQVERAYFTHDGAGYRIDLSRTNLRHANLQYLNFEKASFFRSQMQAAYCNGTNFGGANFVYCEMTGVSAVEANFSLSNLSIADISYATLEGADFRNCKTSHTHFVGSNLRGACLKFPPNKDNREVNRAFLINSDVTGATLNGDLSGVVVRDHPRRAGKQEESL